MKSAVLGFLLLTANVPWVRAQTSPISLRIETATGQTQFRLGEAISLTLTFANSAPSETANWMVRITGRDRSVLGFGSDGFLISPETGTSDPWKYRFSGGIAYSGPPGMDLREKTTSVGVDLNQWVRFDRPGHYSLHAVFHVTGPQREDDALPSNEIGIDIVAADPVWQAQQLRDSVALLNTVPDKTDNQVFEQRASAAHRLAYLDTPESVREIARLLGTDDINLVQFLQVWLRSTHHPNEAVAAMKELLRNPGQPVTPMFLDALAALQAAQQVPYSAEPGADPNSRRRFDTQVKLAEQLRTDLAGVIDSKQGTAKAVSIKTLVENLPATTVPPKLRAEIGALFLDLPESQQSELLQSRWDKIAGPEMIPALRRIYETAPQSPYPPFPLLASAVERLYELDPNQTRMLLLDEISRLAPRLPYRTLAMLPDATLPAMDHVLLDHLEHNGGRPAEELISRYATAGILERVKVFYAKHDAEMRSRTSSNVPNIAAPACEPPLVAYFLRVDPASGERLLRQSLAERAYPMGRCWITILGQTASYYVGPEWEKVAIEALQDPTVAVKADAAKSLGQYGSPASAAALWDSFRYWHDWWKDKPAEINEENRRFEQVLVEATAHAKNWRATDEEFTRAHDLCLTQNCKAQADYYRGDRR